MKPEIVQLPVTYIMPVSFQPQVACCCKCKHFGDSKPFIFQQLPLNIPESNDDNYEKFISRIALETNETLQGCRSPNQELVSERKVPFFKKDVYLFQEITILKPLQVYVLKLFKNQTISASELNLFEFEKPILYHFLTKKYFFLRTHR